MLAIENGHIRYALELLNNGTEPSMTPADVSALAGGSVDTLTVAASTTYKKHIQSQTEKTDKPAAEDIDSVILSVLMEKDDVDSSVSKAVNKLDESQQKPLTTQNSINAPQEKSKSSSAPDDAISEDSKMGLWQSVLAFKGAYGISIIKGTDLKDLSFPGGLTVLGEALRLQKFELASRLFQLGYETLTTRTHATYQIPGKADPVSETELTGLIMNYIQDGSRFQLFKDACSYFAQIPSPYQLYLFLRSGDEITSDYPNERGLSVFQVASNLLYVNQENRPISYFLEHLPKGPALAGHRNQSDFLLLLNQNPEAADSSSAGLQMLESLGISRTPRSGMTRGEAPANQIHWALSRIGSLNYSFARLRFDAMSTILKESDGSEQKLQPSLLSLFGATCISSSEAQQRSVVQRFGSQSYGSQFFFEPGTIEGRYSCFSIDSKSSQEVTRTVDSRTTVSLRQGYYLVSNPNYGTLIIRNSSPEFGRTLMTDSAIYLTATVTRQLSAEDLKFPSQQVLNSGTNPIEIKDLDRIRGINFLIDELQGTLQLYRNWKFDTTSTGAWQDLFEAGEKQLVGAHLSPGFGEFVAHLKAIYEYHRESPDLALALAFVHPDFPSWRQFPFTSADESVRRFLPVDDELIRCLEHLANGDGDERELQATGFRNFVQQAGLDKQGELMIMSY
jgi:hypothetical protein